MPLHQTWRNPDAGRVGAEGNEEMMFAGQAVLCRFDEHFADDALQGLLNHQIEPYEILSHAQPA
jgi:hypothetical protein